MDWIIWLIVIAVIVGVVWRLLSRNDARAGSGPAGTTTPTTTAARDSTRPRPDDADRGASDRGAALAGGGPAAPAAAAGMAGDAGRAEPRPEAELEPEPVGEAAAAPTGKAADARPAPAVEPAEAPDAGEWETQWSETPPPEPHAPVHHEGAQGGNAAQGAHAMEGFVAKGAAAAAEPAAAETVAAGETAAAHPVHHPEYTEPHAPTLPGAESAAAEAEVVADTGPATAAATTPAAAPERPGAVEFSDAGTAQTAAPSAASETAAGGPAAEPAGHLALDQPYGEGSAAPAADGSGPEGFTVKGNASSMIYHDETSPAYEEIRAEVWFVSTAYAEAAGFRPPRRSRL